MQLLMKVYACMFVQEIAAASLVAAVEIYGSMEEAARLVLASSGQATSELIGHKCAPLNISSMQGALTTMNTPAQSISLPKRQGS